MSSLDFTLIFFAGTEPLFKRGVFQEIIFHFGDVLFYIKIQDYGLQ